MDHLYNRWNTNETLLQSYRTIFISSQSFLIAVGAVLLAEQTCIWLFSLITALALFMIWGLWFQIVRTRHKVVDYYKFQLGGEEAKKEFDGCSESDYITKKKQRKKINAALKKKNWRLTRIKVDFILPCLFSLIWLALLVAKIRIDL